MLKSNNEIMKTLATEGANKYDFMVQSEGEDMNLKTKVNTEVYVALKLPTMHLTNGVTFKFNGKDYFATLMQR